MNLVNLSKLKVKNKIIFITLVLLLLIFIFLYYYLFPSVAKIKKLRGEIIKTKIEIKKDIERDNNMDILTSKLEKIKPKIAKIDGIFISTSKGRELEFILALEDLANKNNINQTFNINRVDNNKNGKIVEVPIELTASGNFKNIMSYLGGLESMNYYIAINNIVANRSQSVNHAFSHDNSEDEISLVNLKIKALSYWY